MDQFGKQQTVAPAEDPHTLQEAKEHLRVDHNHEDDLIAEKYAGALSFVEEQTNRQIVRATWEITFDRFPSGSHPQLLPLGQLATASCAYSDASGDPAALTMDDFKVTTTREPGYVSPKQGKTWPTARAEADSVVWTITAGWANAAAVPANVKAVLLLMLGHLYEHREAATEVALREIPIGVRRMLVPLCYDDQIRYEPKRSR